MRRVSLVEYKSNALPFLSLSLSSISGVGTWKAPAILYKSMASQDKGRRLPKFGEWDVNDPASAEGFTVIFNKARDDKRTSDTAGTIASPQRNDNAYKQTETYQRPPKRRWFCCG